MAQSLSMRNRWVRLICGILLIAVAVAVIVITYTAGADKMDWILFGLIGMVGVVYGILLIVFNICFNRDVKLPMVLLYGAFFVALGVVCGAALPHAMTHGDALAWLIGIFTAVTGVVLVTRGIVLLSKIKIGWFLLFVILGVLLVVAGILGVVYHDSDFIPKTVYTIMGAIILAFGCWLVYDSMKKSAS